MGMFGNCRTGPSPAGTDGAAGGGTGNSLEFPRLMALETVVFEIDSPAAPSYNAAVIPGYLVQKPKRGIEMNLTIFAASCARPRAGRRLTVLAASLIVIGFCVAVFKTVGFGTDPGSTFSLGISAWTGMSFGTCQLAFNLLLFLPVIRLDLSRIGIGTVGNMVGIGYVAEYFMGQFAQWTPPGGFSLTERVLLFAVSMVCFLLAVSFYMVVDMGVAPYDAVPQLIAARTGKLSPRAVRMLWDVSLLSAGFLMGSAVGLTTLITGFCLGPAIAFVSGHVKSWFE